MSSDHARPSAPADWIHSHPLAPPPGSTRLGATAARAGPLSGAGGPREVDFVGLWRPQPGRGRAPGATPAQMTPPHVSSGLPPLPSGPSSEQKPPRSADAFDRPNGRRRRPTNRSLWARERGGLRRTQQIDYQPADRLARLTGTPLADWPTGDARAGAHSARPVGRALAWIG